MLHTVAFKEFAEEFKLGKGDILVTNEWMYKPYVEGLGLDMPVIYQEKYGAGEPTDEMMDAMKADMDKYEYDSENRMIKDTDLEQDGSVGYWEEYLYDEYGNPSREIFHYSTGDQTDWYTYEYVYDNDGYMLEETCYYKGTKSYYRIYEKAEVLSKYVNNTAFE